LLAWNTSHRAGEQGHLLVANEGGPHTVTRATITADVRAHNPTDFLRLLVTSATCHADQHYDRRNGTQ